MYTEELYEEGIVKEAKDGMAVINIQDSDKCVECSAKIYCKPVSSKDRCLTVRDPFGVYPGDKVRIVINGSKILSVSFFLYGISLVLLLIGIFIGMDVFKTNKELFSSLLGIGLVFVYAILLSIFSRKSKVKSYPEIVFVSSPR